MGGERALAEFFCDQLVECKNCHHRFRIDHLLEAKGIKPKYDKEVIQLPAEVKCPDCDGNLTEPKSFNLMFKTFIGTTEDSTTTAYLRPETAGGMFVNFKNVLNVTRRRLPFGIAQIGKCFRNEITPAILFSVRASLKSGVGIFYQPQFASWRMGKNI